MLRSGKLRIAEVMRSESVVEAAQEEERGNWWSGWVWGGCYGEMELGPYRSFYTELVMAFTGLRSG